MKKLFEALAALVFSFALIACGNNGPTTVQSVGQITVDGAQSRAQVIDAGHYNQVDVHINDTNFPAHVQGKHVKTMALIAFNRRISSEDADANIRVLGYHSANLDECLAYGREIAKVRQKYNLAPPSNSVVCLGQSALVDGRREVPGLWRYGGNWKLDLNWWDGGWHSGWRFLAVRN